MKIQNLILTVGILGLFAAPAFASDYTAEPQTNNSSEYITANEINIEIENLLGSYMSPAQSVQTFFVYYNCPFETEKECLIWQSKPTINETAFIYEKEPDNSKLYEFIDYASYFPELTANEPVAEILTERYKIIMNSANACCTDGMIHQLKSAGAEEDLIYDFLINDTNFYNIGDRCLFMNDDEIENRSPNTKTAETIADVRNGCLCRSKKIYETILEPFYIVYYMIPDFRYYPFDYTYKDGLNREITVSLNQDIQKIMVQLQNCPE